MANILVVDDELGIRELLSEILSDEGHTVDLAENAEQARKHRASSTPDLVLLDIWMPDTDGISLLKEWVSTGVLSMPVVMMSGHATIDTAVDATRLGAVDFLEKPITLQKLLSTVEQVLNPSGLSKLDMVRPVGQYSQPADAAAQTPLVPNAIDEVDAELVSGLSDAQKVFNLEGTLREAKDAFEYEYFSYHLAKEQGSMTRLANKIGLERTHLYRKLKQMGISIQREKKRLRGEE